MIGLKINEFDNSDGSVESFNRIFPKTLLLGEGDVEIGDIVDCKYFSLHSVYVRTIKVNGQKMKFDFGHNNFHNNEDFLVGSNVRFKYQAKDLDENVLAEAYNYKDLAAKMNCNLGLVKRRMEKSIEKGSNAKQLFNVTRREI